MECVGCKREDCGFCINCKDMKKFGGQGKKKQKCIHRVCTEMTPIDKGMVSTMFRIFHYQTFIDQLQKKTNQKLTENLEARHALPVVGSQPPQSKET